MSTRWLTRLAICSGLLLGAANALGAPDLLLDISLDPHSRQFEAEAELQPATWSFRFLLHESLRVTSARAGTEAARVEQQGERHGCRQWQIKTQPGQKLVIRYAGRLPPLERNRDHRSVLGGMPPMSAAEGSFLSAASCWYPRPADLFSYRVKLAVPHDQRALVAGRRTAETLPRQTGDSYRASFEFSQPGDGIDLMAGPWTVREKAVPRAGQSPIYLRTFFPGDLDAVPGLAQAYLDDSQAYIERYSKAIGDYPYSEFSIVASPLPTGFGMPTLTYIGADVLRLPFIRKTSLGHEILHNWWGNGVYVDFARGNWSEGLTTFMADYAYKEDESAAAASEMRLAWLRDAAAFSGQQAGSLRDFRSRANAVGAMVGYGQSAMLFVMLRDRLGPKAFDQGIRNFWTAQRFRIAGWEDLQRAFESASGEKLDSFFAAWLELKTLPEVAVANTESRPRGKGHQLNIRFARTPTDLPLRLPIEIGAGTQRETHWINLGSGQNSAALTLSFAPQTLRLDPEMRVWRRLAPGQLPPILRQWIAANAPQLVIASNTPAVELAVKQLAGRFFEAPAQPLEPARLRAALNSNAPILLAGTHDEIDQALARAGLPARPSNLAGQGSAQVWTVPGQPFRLAVISGQDAAAVNALQRGLPHYGGQSWLVFEQGRAINKGIWPASIPEIAVSHNARKDTK
jgi:hypothetical protein